MADVSGETAALQPLDIEAQPTALSWGRLGLTKGQETGAVTEGGGGKSRYPCIRKGGRSCAQSPIRRSSAGGTQDPGVC